MWGITPHKNGYAIFNKTQKPDVIEFEKNLKENLLLLRTELLLHSYKPKQLKTFVIRDPKTRKISKSDFRDRVVHHALCNIIEPHYERKFIFDSYANRKGKGTLKAIQRFDFFKRKSSKNNTRTCFVLKADIRHYFETVDHQALLSIIKEKIKDGRILQLIKIILSNYVTKEKGKGMPLGNLTSQFFANVYLDKLDQFAKHKLKARYYIRYVDDFVMIHNNKDVLEDYKKQTDAFISGELNLILHPDKSKIITIKKGVEFLGFRTFYHHRLLKQKNIKKFRRKLSQLKAEYDVKKIDYNCVYEFWQGWTAYAINASTYNLRQNMAVKFQNYFPNEISSIEIDRHLKVLEHG